MAKLRGPPAAGQDRTHFEPHRPTVGQCLHESRPSALDDQAAVDAIDRYEDFMKFLHSNVGHDLQPIHLLCPDQQFVPKLRYQAKTFRELTANYLA